MDASEKCMLIWFIPPRIPHSQMDFFPKTFIQIILAAKWLVRHSNRSHKQKRWPLPSLLSVSFSMPRTLYTISASSQVLNYFLTLKDLCREFVNTCILQYPPWYGGTIVFQQENKRFRPRTLLIRKSRESKISWPRPFIQKKLKFSSLICIIVYVCIGELRLQGGQYPPAPDSVGLSQKWVHYKLILILVFFLFSLLPWLGMPSYRHLTKYKTFTISFVN